jgi:hypothetical protein
LDDDLAPEDGSRIVGNAIDTAITRRARQLCFETHLLEKIRDQRFELAGGEFHEIRALVEFR